MDIITKHTSDIENKSNKDLIQSMDYLNNEFDKTKNSIINLTYYLDNIELSYNKILKEYQKRQNGVG
jgi:hypothetical protein